LRGLGAVAGLFAVAMIVRVTSPTGRIFYRAGRGGRWAGAETGAEPWMLKKVPAHGGWTRSARHGAGVGGFEGGDETRGAGTPPGGFHAGGPGWNGKTCAFINVACAGPT